MAKNAFQPEAKCKVCIAVKADRNLFKRIYASKFYVKGGESLLALSEDTGLHYKALSRHVKKHQHMTDDKLVTSQLNQIARANSRAAVAKAVRTADVRQTILDRLSTALDGRDLSEVTDKDLLALTLKAAKDTDDVAAKKKDQEVDILRLMQGVRGGESPALPAETEEDFEDFDPWIEEGEVVEPQ